MNIHHIAIWTNDLERLKKFYYVYFHFTVSEKYINPQKEFRSYFLSGERGAKLEIMQKPEIPDNKNDALEQNIGINHIAFNFENKEDVDVLTAALKRDGYTILSEPRDTGDGYYESCILDPDSNRIEIIFK
jgi:lactoylglutathione lyase